MLSTDAFYLETYVTTRALNSVCVIRSSSYQFQFWHHVNKKRYTLVQFGCTSHVVLVPVFLNVPFMFSFRWPLDAWITKRKTELSCCSLKYEANDGEVHSLHLSTKIIS